MSWGQQTAQVAPDNISDHFGINRKHSAWSYVCLTTFLYEPVKYNDTQLYCEHFPYHLAWIIDIYF